MRVVSLDELCFVRLKLLVMEVQQQDAGNEDDDRIDNKLTPVSLNLKAQNK